MRLKVLVHVINQKSLVLMGENPTKYNLLFVFERPDTTVMILHPFSFAALILFQVPEPSIHDLREYYEADGSF